ncbi:metalloregulator ArsR/SmtB family transcription factor [Staphylococcus chromogenes]|nr:metalloregulator ArsR/SmtB family transcription factor [Staphylococcus chromogenes]
MTLLPLANPTGSCCNDVALPQDPTPVVELFKAVADATRLKLLFLIAERGCNDVCGCDLADAMGVSAPTITHHMKKLIAVGLVTREQKGKWAHFTINRDVFAHVQTLVSSLNAPEAVA